MAAEIQFDHTTGRTCYVQIRNSVGQIWNTAGVAFETYVTANIADYDIAATEQGTASGVYSASMPAAVAGAYNVTAKERAGGSPAETDTTIGVGEVEWDGIFVAAYAQRTVIRGTVGATAPSTTSFTPSALEVSGAAADQFKGRIIIFDKLTATAALRGQATDITASSNAALPVFTYTALTTAPASGDTFQIV